MQQHAMGETRGGFEQVRVALARYLSHDLAVPVRVRESRRHHTVTVMRGVEVAVHRRRRCIVARGRSGPWPNDWLNGQLRLDRPLSGTLWAHAWWWVTEPTLPAPLRDLAARVPRDTLVRWIIDTAQSSGLLASAREQLLAALRLDAGLLQRARALQFPGRCASGDYCLVWRYPRESVERLRESPLLWPLYGVLRSSALSPRDDLGVVRQRLRSMGLSKSGWKSLCQHGSMLWWPMRHAHEFQRDPVREIVEHANLLAASGHPELPPTALALAQARVRSLGTSRQPLATLPVVMAAWRRMADLSSASARALFARTELEDVLTWWLLMTVQPRVPAAASWTWFLQRYRRDLPGETEPNVAWPTFGRPSRVDDTQVEPLADLHAIRHSGRLLGNCLARFEASRAENASEAFFLMRDQKERPCAVFSARPPAKANETPWVCDLRRRFNQPAEEHLWAVAKAYLAQTVRG